MLHYTFSFFFKQSKVTDLHKGEYYPKWEMYQADSILLEYTDIVLNKVYRFTQRKTLPKKKEQCDSALAEWEMLLAFSFALWRTMAKTWHGSSTPGSKKGFTPLNCLFQVIQMITQVPRSIIWIKKAFTTILGFYSFLPGIVILLSVLLISCVSAPNCSDPEPGVVLVGEDRHPVERVHQTLQYLPPYDPSVRWATEEKLPFLYWKIRDFAHAYRSGITTPSVVSSSLDRVLACFSGGAPASLLFGLWLVT